MPQIKGYRIRPLHGGWSWQVVGEGKVFADGWEPTAVLARVQAFTFIADLAKDTQQLH